MAPPSNLEEALGKEPKIYRRPTQNPALPKSNRRRRVRDPRTTAQIKNSLINMNRNSPSYKAAVEELRTRKQEDDRFRSDRQFDLQNRSSTQSIFDSRLRNQKALEDNRALNIADDARATERVFRRQLALKQGKPDPTAISVGDWHERIANGRATEKEILNYHIAMGSIYGGAPTTGNSPTGLSWKDSFNKQGLGRNWLAKFGQTMDNLHDKALAHEESGVLGQLFGAGSLNETKIINYAKRTKPRDQIHGKLIPLDTIGVWFRIKQGQRHQDEGTLETPEINQAFQGPDRFPDVNKFIRPLKMAKEKWKARSRHWDAPYNMWQQ